MRHERQGPEDVVVAENCNRCRGVREAQCNLMALLQHEQSEFVFEK